MHPAPVSLDLAAIVLAGGHGRRVGAEKASLELEGRPLLARVVERVGVFASPVLVVAREGQALPALPSEARVVRDEVREAGPLVGVLTGLRALGRDAPPWIYLTATDLPFPSAAVARRMLTLARAEGRSVCVAHTGQAQPLPSVIALDAIDAIDAALARGERRLRAIVELAAMRVVAPSALVDDARVRAEDPELAALRDVDTPDDLAWARAHAARLAR